MLTVRLDSETEQQLTDLLSHDSMLNRSDLIKQLIRERWLALSLDRSFVERRGGHPKHVLQDVSPDLSERASRKQAMADFVSGVNDLSFSDFD